MNVQKNNIKCDSTCEIWLNCNKQYTEPRRYVAFLRHVFYEKVYTDEKLKLVSVCEYNIFLSFLFCLILLSSLFWLTRLAFLLLPLQGSLLLALLSFCKTHPAAIKWNVGFFFSLLESWSFSLVNVALYYILVFPIYLITVGEFSMCKPNTGIPQRKIFLCLWILGYRD